jgi:hypothetical protein
VNHVVLTRAAKAENNRTSGSSFILHPSIDPVAAVGAVAPTFRDLTLAHTTSVASFVAL